VNIIAQLAIIKNRY